MNINFCSRCGGPTKSVATHDNTHYECQSCGQTYYVNPKPTSDAVLVTPDFKALVAVRAHEPHKGMLDLPGGFIDEHESIEQALERELREELGLAPDDYSQPVYLMSYPNVYPWGQELNPVLAASFTAQIPHADHVTPQDDVESVALKSLDELHPEDFAWAHQYEVVAAAIEYWKSA
jgi:ADP-ribose pyrophosphatase YjhB (NUDIX family)